MGNKSGFRVIGGVPTDEPSVVSTRDELGVYETKSVDKIVTEASFLVTSSWACS